MATGGRAPWYRLDNAAKIYPAVLTQQWAAMFRLAATLREPVAPLRLSEALNCILPRFPSFAVRLRTGLFWYYFEPNPRPCPVHLEEGYPCGRIRPKDPQNGYYLFRVLYYGSRISLEVFHALADGSGAMTFFKTLLAQYLTLGGVPVPPGQGVLALDEVPQHGETEDAFPRFATGRVKGAGLEARAWAMPGTLMPVPKFNVVTGMMPLEQVLALARTQGVTLTEYLTAALLYVLLEIQAAEAPRRQRPVKVSVPVNLRRYCPSATLRNFSYMVNPGIDPRYGTYTFEEVLSLTHHYIRYHMQKRFLAASIAGNVAIERNLLLRIMPLKIKNVAMRAGYDLLGETRVTSTMTNLGVVSLPETMVPHIQGFEVILGPSRLPRMHCAAVSYEGKLVLTFSRNIKESHVERQFFTFLVKAGIPVTIRSNGG